tara:strand:- start:201 stop:824 length:624 start_codon:yes stop_codon:yes gene_type:complete
MDTELENKKNLMFFLKAYYKLIVGLALTLIIIGLFYMWFDHKENLNKTKISDKFIQAKILLTDNNKVESKDILENIINQKNKIYSPLSLFLIIDQDLVSDNKIIIDYFNIILSIKGIENEDLNLLKLKKAIFISDFADEKEILDLLNPIINSESVWRIQCLKFLGDKYYFMKEYNKAEQYYSKLLDEKNTNIDINEIKRKMKLIKNG